VSDAVRREEVAGVSAASDAAAPARRPAARRPAPREFAWTPGRAALFAAVMAYLVIVIGLPLGALVVEGLAVGMAAIARVLSAPEALSAIGRSAGLVAIAILVNGVVGIAAAVVLVRHRFAGRGLLDAVVDVPFAVSPVMTGLAFLLVFGRGGWLAPLLDAHNVRVVFNFPALVLATLFVTLPFTLREVGYVLAELGTTEEEVAATLGASPWQTFWHVTLPNVRHGLTLGVTLTTARALGEFGAVLILGGAISGQTETATTFIYGATEERQDAAAHGMALLLALASVALLLVLRAVRRTERS
jgi:sulfate/thiosulfate transport system permease protein